MKTILLTGHTGFIGSEIKNDFELLGHRVLTLGRSEDCDYQVNLGQPELIEKLDINEQIDEIIHCAAINETKMSENIILYYNVNVVATRGLLELAKKLNVKEFIFISTFHVYGKDTGNITEKTETNPKNDYGLTHLLSEKIITEFCSWNSMRYKILRPTNVYGIPKDISSFTRWTLVPFQFIKSAYANKEIVIKSNGLQQRNFVSISDVVNSINLDFNGVLNIFGNDTLSIKDYASLVANEISIMAGEKISIKIEGTGHIDNEILNVNNSSQIYLPQKNITPFIREFYLKLSEVEKL